MAVEGFRASAALTAERLASAGDDTIARLRGLAEAYVLFAVEHRAAFRAIHRPPRTRLRDE